MPSPVVPIIVAIPDSALAARLSALLGARPDILIRALVAGADIVIGSEGTDAGEAARIVIMAEPEREALLAGLADGAAAILDAEPDSGELLAAIAAARAGGMFLARGVLACLARPGVAPLLGLTGRETEILAFIAGGMSNKDVARRLALSVRTVESHRLSIRKKTRARNRKQLVELAQSLGLFRGYGEAGGLAMRRPAPGFHET